MTSEFVLHGDHYAPVTSAIGFLQAPLEVVSTALKAWRESIHGVATANFCTGGLVENIHRLEPLTGGVRPRELLVATEGGEWTAVFDCGAQGGDPASVVGHLSQSLQVQGVALVHIPDQPGWDAGARFGARQFELFGPLQTDFLNIVRSISVVRDGARWRFDAAGTVQDFEDAAACSSRRTVERLTPAMLARYAAALGIAAFDDAFYAGPCVLVESPVRTPPGGLSLSINEARARFGIV